MRIVILADPLDNQLAGIHHYTRNLVRHLARYDVKHEYIVLRRKLDGILPADRQVIVRNYRFPGYAALRMFLIIPWKLRRMKADVVIEPAHFGPFNLPRRIKRVTVIHDLTPVLFPRMHRFHSQLLQKIFLKGILKKADLVVTNSDNTSNDLVTYYPPVAGKVKRIFLGRDETMTARDDILTVERFTGRHPYFLYAGTIEPRKNLISLLRAYAIFRKKGNMNHKLVLAGGRGWKSRSFFNTLHEHPFRDDIVLCGYTSREELQALYSHATAFVFPSLYEGFGLPVVEAMSCGLPCLISSRASLPEVGGDAAIYFDPTDIEQITTSMIKIASDDTLRKELSEKALLQARRFSWEKYVRELDKSIRNMMRI